MTGLGSLRPLDILGLEALIAGNDFEDYFLSFEQGLVTAALNGAEVDEDILSRILCNKAKTLPVVEPLYFATGHIFS
jgi:hypothetical protein